MFNILTCLLLYFVAYSILLMMMQMVRGALTLPHGTGKVLLNTILETFQLSFM